MNYFHLEQSEVEEEFHLEQKYIVYYNILSTRHSSKIK